MDEMNPAYENFLNNMTRLGGSPRETTRRVSASSFLGRDNIAKQVELNSRKITILKNVIKAQQITTGAMLATLSTPTEGIEQSIIDIKGTMSSILQTLEAQEKFEYEKFLDTQRRLQNEKRRGRETKLEKDKPVFNFFKNQLEKTIAPVKNGFLQTIGFFFNLVAGKVILDLLKFLSSPAMLGIVNFITGFIKNFFPLIVGGIIAATGGIIFLLGKMVGITRLLQIAAFILGGGSAGAGKVSKGLSFLKRSKFGTSVMKNLKRIKFQEGGLLKGKSHKDGGIPIEAEGGEFIVSKKAMEQEGAAEAVQLINSGNLGGLAEVLRGMSGDEKLNMHKTIETFFTDPRNLRYRETVIDSEGESYMKTDMSGYERYKNTMIESFGGMSGYMPDLGGFAESTLSGDTGELAKQFFTNRGTTMGAEINKVIPGTDEFFLNAVSQSINESVDTKRIKGNNNISIPSPPIIPSNDQTSMPDFSNLPSVPKGNKEVPIRNELPVCSLNPSDSNKCDTLGMLAP